MTTLTRDEVLAIANEHLKDPFETVEAETFETSPPDDVNTEQRLTIVATDLDSGLERIVGYLSSFGVPIDVAFFAFLEDEGRRYLARSWLISGDVPGASPISRKTSKNAEWNGKDWFVSFEDGLGRSWDDGRRYGFVSAGDDVWYSRTLRSLPVGARIFVHIPGSGYVAVGQTLKEAERYDTATVLADRAWVPLSEQDLHAEYVHREHAELFRRPSRVCYYCSVDPRRTEAGRLLRRECSPIRTVRVSCGKSLPWTD